MQPVRMGSCLSLDEDEEKAKARFHSERIDQNLQCMAAQDTGIVKILLLGEYRQTLNTNDEASCRPCIETTMHSGDNEMRSLWARSL